MIKICVKYFGNWRDVSDKSSETIELPDKSNVVDLIYYLSKRYGDNFISGLFDDNENGLLVPFSISLNGKVIETDEIYTYLHNGDVVMFLFPIIGG